MPLRLFTLILSLMMLCSCADFPANASQQPPLIPREILFGPPTRIAPTISPDGTRLAWLAPDPHNIVQLWTQSLPAGEAQCLTANPRDIRTYYWAYDNHTLLYLLDIQGDENVHLFATDLATRTPHDLTPIPGARVDWLALNPNFPDTALVSLNARDHAAFDVHHLNLTSGELRLDTQNPGDVNFWLADPSFHIRAAQAIAPDGGTEIRIRPSDTSPWKTLLKSDFDDTLSLLDFNEDAISLFLISSVGRDTAAVIQKNIATGKETLLASDPHVDAGNVLLQPYTHQPRAVAFSPDRTRWTLIDPALRPDFEHLTKVENGDFTIVSRTRDDATWIVGYSADCIASFERAPGRFYRYDRTTQHAEFLFASRPKLQQYPLAPMQPVVIPARDGLPLHGYLTLPLNVSPHNLPLVLYPHGGPWERDSWGYNANVQFLANRGYAVLQPNYRGSTGYGKSFLAAGNKQWGLAMQYDLIDAVHWAIDQHIADPKRIAILGGSYGGYCALNALTKTPETFACAVDVFGVSNLRTLIASFPLYWKPYRALVDARIADIDDPRDADLIRNASPLNFADRITRPLMIAHGSLDVRCKQAESDQIVAAIEKNHGRVTYIVYPDEGHGLQRPENRIDLSARIEAFLGEHLGGRVEPTPAEEYPGSTAIVRNIPPR